MRTRTRQRRVSRLRARKRYAAIRIPVLQLIGGDSGRTFTDGTWELDRLLSDGRVAIIPGAKHAAHHTHPERFAAEVLRFLDDAPDHAGLPSGHD